MTPRNRTPHGDGGDGTPDGDGTPGRPKGDGEGDGPSKKYGSIDASDVGSAQGSTRQRLDAGRASGQPGDPGGRGKDGGDPTTAERDRLIEEAQQNGHAINPDDVVHIGRDRDGKIVWLEKGNDRAGLEHMTGDKRVAEFEKAGIPKEDIGEVAFRAATEGKPIGITGRDRVVYEVEYNGETKRIAVTVGSNGFIVGANPVGNKKIKPLPGADGGGG